MQVVDFSLVFVLMIDALVASLGAALSQEFQLTPAERRYTTIEWEDLYCTGVVYPYK